MTGGRLVALPTGYKVGRYTLNAVLGEGGFGITYRARDEALRRDVAIKEYLPADVAVRQDDTTIRPRSASDTKLYEWGLQRFVDEARTLAAMHAPNIVSVHDFMETNGTGYMVMELIEGRSLALILDREGPLPAERLMPITRQLLLGLEAVHNRGYLHRDIKPGNILIRPSGQAVLVDFGAARISRRGGTHAMTSVYTPGYAPAEQYAADGEQGPWTDIYALAATLYEAITGWPPPDATTRLLADRMVPAVKTGEGRYPESFLAGIDSGLGLRKEDRPPSVGVWRALLFDEPMPVETDLSATRTDFPTVIAGQRSSKSGAVAMPRPSQPGATPSKRPPDPAQPSQRQPSLREKSPSRATLGDDPPPRRARWPLIAGAIAILLLGAGGGLVASGGFGLFDGGAEQRRQEADRRAAEERRQAELNAEAARRRAEEEARAKAAADEAERRRIEEAAARQRADEEAARARAADEARRRAADEEAARARAIEEEARRKAAAEEDARRRAAADEAQRRAADEARRKADEEAARARAAEDARRRAAEEEARRKAADDPQRRAQEEARRKAEEEARAKAAADEARRRAAAEEERRRREEAARNPPQLHGGDGRWSATASVQTHARNRVCTDSFTISGVAANGVLQATTTYGGPMVIRIGDDGLKAVSIAYDGRPVRTYWGNMRSTLVEFLDGCIYRITWTKQ